MTKNTIQTTTEYAGNYVYENGNLQFFFQPEGYVSKETTGFQYIYQYKDHLGNIRLSYTDSDKDGKIDIEPAGQDLDGDTRFGENEIVEENNYYPFGLKQKGYNANINGRHHKYMFGGKEQQNELGLNWYDITARNYDPALGRWINVDPLATERNWVSPYNYVQNNPLNIIDTDGALDNPVYGSDGTYRGDTKEGFTGEVIIYDGKEDFTKLTKTELLSKKGADTYDNQRRSLSGSVKSKIWTHIVSKMEGQQIYEETFSMSDLTGGKIHFDYDKKPKGSWVSSYILGKGKGEIKGSDKYSYSTTVENIQSSIVVHEWYSHIKKNNGSSFGSHRLAYKNVINYKSLWNKTTDGYKGFYMRALREYTIDESNGKKIQVDPLYRNLYKKYYKKYD